MNIGLFLVLRVSIVRFLLHLWSLHNFPGATIQAKSRMIMLHGRTVGMTGGMEKKMEAITGFMAQSCQH